MNLEKELEDKQKLNNYIIELETKNDELESEIKDLKEKIEKVWQIAYYLNLDSSAAEVDKIIDILKNVK